MICLVSDTHENVPMIRRALPMIKALAPSLILHCGDIISPPTLEEFRGLPMRFVFGNNDGERAGLREKAAELSFGDIDDDLELTVEGKDIFITHGTRASTVEVKADSQVYDYIFHGHTHQRRNEKIGRTRVVNPGAMFQASIYSFATVDLAADIVTFHQIDH